MRDGRWKLVRPAIPALMAVSAEDFAMDVAAKYNPDDYTDILRTAAPDPAPWSVPPAQLFDIAADPGESRDLAAQQPERVARMERQLAAWFADVERDRRSIPA